MSYIIFGMIAGCGAALGLGGGTILILLLNFFTDTLQYKIQGINLIFFIPTAVTAIYLNYKNKIIDFSIAKKCIFTGVLGSVFGSILAGRVVNDSLKKYFGIFLLIIAINGIYTFISQYINDKKVKNNDYKN